MKRQTSILLYILSAYVLIQFAWWAFYLIELSAEIEGSTEINKRVGMILGEGIVFFAILLAGILKIRSSIKKEIHYTKQQNNFLLSVTHELKTPLTSNKLLLQTLQKRKDLEKGKQEEIIQQAIAENERLSEMIDNILMTTRIDGEELIINYEEANLSEEFLHIILKWENSRIQITKDIEPDITAEADLSILQIILLNLLENAYKYAGKEAKIEVYLRKEVQKITFGVKDNGKGISPEYTQEIFNKFMRIGNEETRNNKGTGLGLYIVKKMVQYHNGDIKYLPNTPNGAHFKITLNEYK